VVLKTNIYLSTVHFLSSTKIFKDWKILSLNIFKIYKNYILNNCIIEEKRGVSMLGVHPVYIR